MYQKNFKQPEARKPYNAQPAQPAPHQKGEASQGDKEVKGFVPLQFVDVAGVKWTKRGDIMVICDHMTEENKKVAVSITCDYFSRVLSLKPLEKQEERTK